MTIGSHPHLPQLRLILFATVPLSSPSFSYPRQSAVEPYADCKQKQLIRTPQPASQHHYLFIPPQPYSGTSSNYDRQLKFQFPFHLIGDQRLSRTVQQSNTCAWPLLHRPLDIGLETNKNTSWAPKEENKRWVRSWLSRPVAVKQSASLCTEEVNNHFIVVSIVCH